MGFCLGGMGGLTGLGDGLLRGFIGDDAGDAGVTVGCGIGLGIT